MNWAWGVLLGVGFLPLAVKGANVVEDSQTKSDPSFERFDELFKRYGASWGVPWKRLKAIAMSESSLGRHPSVARGLAAPNDVAGSASEDGKSWGLMQVTVNTARDFDPTVTAEKLNAADYSVKIAAQFLASLQRQFAEEQWIVKSYNQGAGNTRKEIAGKITGYAETYWERYQRNMRLIQEKQG